MGWLYFGLRCLYIYLEVDGFSFIFLGDFTGESDSYLLWKAIEQLCDTVIHCQEIEKSVTYENCRVSTNPRDGHGQFGPR